MMASNNIELHLATMSVRVSGFAERKETHSSRGSIVSKRMYDVIQIRYNQSSWAELFLEAKHYVPHG